MPLGPITIRYSFRPRTRTLATGQVADLFGLADEEPPHIVAENVTLDIRPGDLVLFTGPSGSGKSSLLRDVGRQLAALDANAMTLPDVALVDALPGSVGERLDALAACGLSEARLLLRTAAELSDGQRYRFRLALAVAQAQRGGFVMADEFCAVLDRTLAKVLAFNVRKLCTRSKTGFILATTHDDLLADLDPDVWVRCLGDGAVEVERRDVKKNDQFRGRVLALGRRPRRLAVLRSVALPQPPARLRPPGRAALARDRADRRLRVRGTGGESAAPFAVLRPDAGPIATTPRGAERTTLAARARRAASHLSRRGHRRGVRAAGVRNLSGAVDRNALGDGSGQSVLRAGRFRPRRRRSQGRPRQRGRGVLPSAVHQCGVGGQKPVQRAGLLRVCKSRYAIIDGAEGPAHGRHSLRI